MSFSAPEGDCKQNTLFIALCQRCGQPDQQQGRRIPPFILERAFSIRIFLVSAFLPDVTQQIHSLRASGVISLHAVLVVRLEAIAFCRSGGSLCTIYLFKYLLATLSANEGNIMNTVAISNRINTIFSRVRLLSFSGIVRTIKIPMMPKRTDAQTNTRAAIFCIVSV